MKVLITFLCLISSFFIVHGLSCYDCANNTREDCIERTNVPLVNCTKEDPKYAVCIKQTYNKNGLHVNKRFCGESGGNSSRTCDYYNKQVIDMPEIENFKCFSCTENKCNDANGNQLNQRLIAAVIAFFILLRFN